MYLRQIWKDERLRHTWFNRRFATEIQINSMLVVEKITTNWIGFCSVLRPRQHSITGCTVAQALC